MLKNLESLVKSVVPQPIKRRLRAAHRRRALGRAIRELQAMPEVRLTDALVQDLIYGWGNEGWSADAELFKAIAAYAAQAKGPIVECGSGLSTLLLGIVADRTGQRVWTLEHHGAWAERMRTALADFGIKSVGIVHAPLRPYDGFSWYGAPLDRMPSGFALGICDGPPADTPGGRYGFFPVMRRHLAPGCAILVDDYERAPEKAIVERWRAEAPMHVDVHGTDQQYAVLTVGKA